MFTDLLRTALGVKAVDPVPYLAEVILVIVIVVGASWIPAHRASGTDPLSLLRPE
jgi:ABC-type lipoprotein release transport system permease subunit